MFLLPSFIAAAAVILLCAIYDRIGETHFSPVSSPLSLSECPYRNLSVTMHDTLVYFCNDKLCRSFSRSGILCWPYTISLFISST